MAQFTCWFSIDELALIDRIAADMRISKAEVVRTAWRAAMTIFPDLREIIVLKLEQEKANLTTEISHIKEGIVKNPITIPEPAFQRPGRKDVEVRQKTERELFLHFVDRLSELDDSTLKRIAIRKCREQISLHPEWIGDIPEEHRHLMQEVGK